MAQKGNQSDEQWPSDWRERDWDEMREQRLCRQRNEKIVRDFPACAIIFTACFIWLNHVYPLTERWGLGTIDVFTVAAVSFLVLFSVREPLLRVVRLTLKVAFAILCAAIIWPLMFLVVGVPKEEPGATLPIPVPVHVNRVAVQRPINDTPLTEVILPAVVVAAEIATSLRSESQPPVKDVHVRSYFDKNGRFVSEHVRSRPSRD